MAGGTPPTRCRACGSDALSEIYALPGIPVQSCILLDDRKSAQEFPQGSLRLLFCDGCGFIFNADFDARLVDYASTTEESQHFSATFNAFARSLVEEISGRYELGGKTTLEVGCGKGDFLAELASATRTIGLGVDPGFYSKRFSQSGDADICFRQEYFDPGKIDQRIDFIVCRHTLEHIPDVEGFVADFTKLKLPAAGADVFFETPDVQRVLSEGAFWDIYYEHCSYFSMGSHARLFRRFGFDVSELRLAYGDQYILQYARFGHGAPSGSSLAAEADLDEMRRLASDFKARVLGIRQKWRAFTRARAAEGKRVALWGGGSKAVAFLTTDDIHRYVQQVVDINPFKQGKFLPGTGLEVIAPGDLVENPPDTVIAMNAVYCDEISKDLGAMGLAPELVAL